MQEDRINKVEEYIANENWKKARNLIIKLLKKSPEDHWLLTRLSITYYEEYKYDRALLISEKAIKLAPNCPLSLWDYACCLDMTKSHNQAIKVWERIQNLGLKKVAFDECGEGIRFAKSLLNDCTFRIGLSYKKMNKFSIAKKYFVKHLKNRCPSIPSLYTLKEVRNEVNVIFPRKSGHNEEMVGV